MLNLPQLLFEYLVSIYFLKLPLVEEMAKGHTFGLVLKGKINKKRVPPEEKVNFVAFTAFSIWVRTRRRDQCMESEKKLVRPMPQWKHANMLPFLPQLRCISTLPWIRTQRFPHLPLKDTSSNHINQETPLV